MISRFGSLRGYSLKKWLSGTKESFKALVMGASALAAWYVINAATPAAQGVWSALVAVVVKWLLDLFDFWLSDVEVSE